MAERTYESVSADAKLPVVATVVRAFRAVVTAPLSFARMALLPILSTAAILYFFPSVPDLPGSLDMLFLSLLTVPLSYLGFAWLLFSLREEKARVFIARRWLGAYLRVLGHCLPWFILFFGTAIGFINAERYLNGLMSAEQAFETPIVPYALLLWIAVMLLALSFMARLLLAAPAAATGYPTAPGAAWRLSRGQGLRCFGAILLVFLSIFIGSYIFFVVYNQVAWMVVSLLGRGSEAPFDVLFIPQGFTVTIAVGLTIGTAVLAEVLAIAFRSFTGWTGPQKKLVERFE